MASKLMNDKGGLSYVMKMNEIDLTEQNPEEITAGTYGSTDTAHVPGCV